VRIATVDALTPEPEPVAEAVRVLRSGGIVALPTETFYGLAADALHPEATARVNVLKGKLAGEPLLLLLAGRGQMAQVSRALPPLFDVLAEQFWPGPLTLVVPAGATVPAAVTGGRGSVAVRVPGLALPRRVSEALGRPVTGPSANVTGRPPCCTAREVAEAFPCGVDLVLDGGTTPGGAASTIVDLCVMPPRVLREGVVPGAALAPHGIRSGPE
jgi:L-threonylcarbamoyladenylate synthase